MSIKKDSRLRRAKKTRFKLRELGETRLTIHRTPRHIYAQVISPEGDKVLAAASTISKAISSDWLWFPDISAMMKGGVLHPMYLSAIFISLVISYLKSLFDTKSYLYGNSSQEKDF